MAAHPVESSLLSRLAAGTAGAVGKEFLRCLVTELAGALNADVAFVAETCGDGEACTLASACRPGIELREGQVFTLAGTPCEDAYTHPLLLVSRGARLRYPEDPFLRRHALDGYLAVALRDARGSAIGHIGVISSRLPLKPAPAELQALQIFAARAGAELERRRHEVALLRAADEERRRIGRDLHDGAQQRLVVLGQALDLALRELEADPGKAVARLSAAREQAVIAGRELRELAHGLHPVGLERGLRPALSTLAVQSPLPVRIEALPEVRPSAVTEATIWFLVSEALTNAIKHAAATELRVRVTHVDDELYVAIADDGRGGACPSRGTGLQGLRARVEALGGSLEVRSPRGAGTALTARLRPRP
ncbi:GAF domain-containing sensor histidine kinase [Solirubrobacter phytolaccae]|uniref:histidine kinase n=1 Tax=Solirubrobacter phytolaccae TaxID=1404360 RepID=A0A9X3NEP2_9ACTN|nr:GAF domain-containing sensor histidine kinase [Solirubrobacter phytolaccae]MDA0183592.1 GAF domain-containing sensor histidine kinase [Solirubrobacter phytolaccae]